jgi:hypothetical protein
MTAPAISEPVIWNNLKLEYIGPTELDYALDSKDRNATLKITNIGNEPISDISFQIAIFGIGNYPMVTGDGGFAVFPNGGNIDLLPGDSYVAQNWLSGIYETRFGNSPPQTGETRAYSFDFILATDNRAFHQANPTSDPLLAGKLTQQISFSNPDYSGGLQGDQVISGQIALQGGSAAGLKVEVATPYSKWFTIDAPVASGTATFQVAVPERDDWVIRISADNLQTVVQPAAAISTGTSITLVPDDPLDYGYSVSMTADAPTGFWRGAVSETEQTFVLIPGQENWSDPGDDAADAALRATSLIRKYTFAGELLWEYAPGWETWGGGMSEDGSKVVFMRNPDITRYGAGDWKLGVLNGTDGTLLWEVTGSIAHLEGLEAAISPDARYVAAGSTQGALGLYDANTGKLLWAQDPGTYGQVRKLVFAEDALYVGSGDGYLVKLTAATGEQIWKTYAGGWPFVNGLSINATAGLISTGTKSKDTSVIDATTGELLWSNQTGALDAVISPDGKYVANFYGDIFEARTGKLAGQTGIAGTVLFSPDSHYLIQADRGTVSIADLGGKIVGRSIDATDTEYGGGEQAQWTYLSADGATLIVASRDMDTPGERGLTIWTRGQATGINNDAPIGPVSPPGGTNPVGMPVATAGDDLLQPGPGDETINGSTGNDSVQYSAGKNSYRLEWSDGKWLVTDRLGSGGTDTLENIERIQFSDQQVIIESTPHATYAELPDMLYHFFLVAFSGAPGVTYMNQLSGALDAGISLQEIVRIFTSKSQFTDLYPLSLSSSQFAHDLTDNVVKSSATQEAKTKAVNDIIAALDNGASRGDVIFNIFGNLAQVDTANPLWGGTSKQFQNQIAVAQVYTDQMSQSTTDIPTLRSVIQYVYPETDVSSNDSIVSLIGTSLMDIEPGTN